MFNISSFGIYIWGALVNPNRTFDKILSEPSPLRYGLSAILLTGVLYTGTVVMGYLNGFGAVTQPWLPIAAADYYFYEAFFTIPVFIVSTVVNAGLVQMLSVLLHGKGQFKDYMAVAGFGLWITIIPFMWIPETITMAIFPQLRTSQLGGTLGLPFILEWVRQIITFSWQMVATVIGVRKVHGLPWSKTLITGLVGYMGYWIIFWTYIR